MHKKIILLLAFIFFIFQIKGQIRWIQQYHDELNGPGYYLSTSYDQGYIISGKSAPNYSPFTWLIKTNINGEILWEKIFGGYFNSTIVDCFDQNKEGEIYLCGATIQEVNSDPTVIKLDNCGNKEWCRSFSTSSDYDNFKDIVTVKNDGCAVLVFQSFLPLYIYKAGILRFSTDGELLWQKYYQSSDQGINSENFQDIFLAQDGGFLLTGYCGYPDPENPDLYWLHPYYLKTDSLGNFEWEVVLHSETADMGGKAWQTILSPSGTCYYSCISHYYHSDTLNAKRPALVKMDLQGDVMGVYDLVHKDYDWGGMRSIAFINDSLLTGGAGWGYSGETSKSRATIFDTLGNIKDTLFLLNTGWLAKTAVTHDGKLLFYNTIEEEDGFDTYLFKLTQDLEQDTFYTRPFVYDSLCPYQIASDTIVPDDCEVIVGVEAWGQGGMEAWGHGELEVWPNPCGGILNFKFSILNSGRDYHLTVYDVFGREVAQIKVPDRSDQVQINVESYPPGVYIAILKNGSNLLGSSKFVVVR